MLLPEQGVVGIFGGICSYIFLCEQTRDETSNYDMD